MAFIANNKGSHSRLRCPGSLPDDGLECREGFRCVRHSRVNPGAAARLPRFALWCGAPRSAL